jgi:hypothetical protein
MEDALLNLISGPALASPGQALAQPGQALARPANRPLLLVISGPYAAAQSMLTLSAHLAQRGPLQVLDGGNRFNAYIVARQLRRLRSSADSAGSPDLRQCLARIRVARAFTCYQMAALIDQTCPGEARATLGSSPTLVIDLLDTFYDESAPLAERRRLAEHCMQRLRQAALSSQPEPAPAGRPGAVVVISLRPPPPGQPDPTGLQELVLAAADQVLFQDGSAPEQEQQLRFF